MTAYEARAETVRRAMQTEGLESLILYSDGEHSFFVHYGADPVRWLAGFKPLGPHSAVLFPLDGAPTLLVTPAWDGQRARRQSWIEQVVATDDFGGALSQAVATLKGPTGIAGGRRFTLPTRRLFENAVLNGGQSTPCASFDAAFDRITKTRDELELSLMERAADIAERGYQHLLEIVRPGMLEYEMAGEVDAFMKSLGADDNFQLLCSSRHHQLVRAPNDRRLDVGDVILGEITPSVGGQFIQICRTAVLGPVSARQHEHYDLLIESLQAGLRAGKPGVTVKHVVEAMNEPQVRAGYGKYCFPPYMRVRGHGMGLGSTAPGDLTLDNETVLESGMSFVLHPNQYLPETGYFMVGEPVLVTDNGLRPFTTRTPAIDSITPSPVGEALRVRPG